MPPALAYPHPEGLGWFVFVSTDPGSDRDYYPDDLIQCFNLARSVSCDYILFDDSFLPVEQLPTYDVDEVGEASPIKVGSANEPSSFDNTQAEKEGWAIFGGAPGDSPYCLEKCDDNEVFEDDVDAWEFVVCKAEGGSAYHRAALEFLKAHSPAEYRAIVDCCFYQPPIQE